jgi:DNA-binding NarL/FixJ family response regulator
MMGPNPIPIPGYFTVEWYIKQKELRKTDMEIAASFFISYALLQKWKRKIGWKFGDGQKFAGRQLNPHTEKMKSLRDQGYSAKKIAELLSVNVATVRNHLKRMVK